MVTSGDWDTRHIKCGSSLFLAMCDMEFIHFSSDENFELCVIQTMLWKQICARLISNFVFHSVKISFIISLEVVKHVDMSNVVSI